MKQLLVLSVLLLAACGPRATVLETKFKPPISVAVNAPCVVGGRPAPVAPLREVIASDTWYSLSEKQRLAHAGAQGLRHQQYGSKLNGATAACP